MTGIAEAAAAFDPPPGHFLLVPNGVPANIGPWLFVLKADYTPVNNDPHVLNVSLTQMETGGYHMSLSWTIPLGDNGPCQPRRRVVPAASLLPRPKSGSHLSGTLFENRQFDPDKIGRTARHKNRQGVRYALTVHNAYAPHADQTMEALFARHEGIQVAVADELLKVTESVRKIRTVLKGDPK